MCGIAGFLGGDFADAAATVRQMTDAIRHRGPDDADAWIDAEAGVALGHRRLSVVDLSPAGHQPMASRDGRLVIVYNGEIYNAEDLRRELTGIDWCGHSDTEVLLEACRRWGVRRTLERLVGMFALALWDREERSLVLARDQLGIKPLFWGRFGGLVLFGSELKALRAHPGWAPAIDRNAVAAFLRHNYVPAPHTVYDGIRKLEPGTLATLKPGGEPVVERYWDLDRVAAEGLGEPFTGSDAEAEEALHALLLDAVGRQMVSDVPLGAFLSGGIDSSTVVALMQARATGPVRTFSIGFREEGYDESKHAAAVARHLGTDHTELTVTPDEAREVIPRLPHIYDEPFADSSQIPTCLLSALTRRHVTVALSGDGGDELFGGYSRYALAERIWAKTRLLPRPARHLLAAAVEGVPPNRWDALFQLVPAAKRPPQPGDKMHKLAGVLTEDEDAIYRRLVSHATEPSELVPGAVEPKGLLWDPAVRARVPGFFERMQYLDTLTYLPDDILTKVDRASMAASLEARVPLLDTRVVEFAWRLPRRLKQRHGQGKWLLRQVLYRHVPPALVERPKMGFGVPIDSWLRGPLKDWAADLLDPSRMAQAGLLRPEPVQALWRQHQSGERNWQYHLWDVLMLQAWLRQSRL